MADQPPMPPPSSEKGAMMYPPLQGEGGQQPQQPPYGAAAPVPGGPPPPQGGFMAPPPPSYDQSQAPPPQMGAPTGVYPLPGSAPVPPGAAGSGPPPPPGLHPATHVVLTAPDYRDHSLGVTCPSCRSEVTTTVEEDTGLGAWVFCLIMFCLGCFFIIPFFFCCVPWCIPQFKTYKHTCPACKAHLGKYKGPLSME